MLRAPAAERNKDFILQVLKEFLLPKPVSSSADNKLQVLEIASGTGQHVAHFAQSLPYIHWWPSEVDQRSLTSIQAHIDELGLRENVSSPFNLDVTKPIEDTVLSNRKSYFDGILCTNMIHISPWSCTLGLFSISNYLLKPKGLLITYGPYSVNGVLTPQSNIDFDRGLRLQNPEWGVRDTSDIIRLGETNQFQFIKSIDMPANNKMLVFQKA